MLEHLRSIQRRLNNDDCKKVLNRGHSVLFPFSLRYQPVLRRSYILRANNNRVHRNGKGDCVMAPIPSSIAVTLETSLVGSALVGESTITTASTNTKGQVGLRPTTICPGTPKQ